DSDSNRVTRNTQVTFSQIQSNNPPVLNTPNSLNGGTNQQVQGTISANDVEDGDLTNQIICNANSNLISINANQGILTVTRTTNNQITTSVTCEVTDSDSNRVTRNTIVTFNQIQSNNPPVLNTPNSLNGGTNQQVQGTISANDVEDGDLTNQIICTTTSSAINVDANQGTLTVTRTTDNSISAIVRCEVTDSDSNRVTRNTQVTFSQIQSNNPPVLNTPASLNGGTNQQVQGTISANDVEDGDLTNQIICTTTSSAINVDANQGILTVTRTFNGVIIAQITCQVQDSDSNTASKNTLILFDRIEPVIPTINVPALLNGGVNQQVIGGVSAFDQVDGDLTNQIICTPSSNQIRINLNSGMLEVIRNTNSSITTQVNCEVTNSNGNSAQGTTQVVFNEVQIPNNPPVLNTPNVLNGETNQQVQGSISAFDIEDGDLTNQISCASTSSNINVNANSGTLQVTRTTDNQINTIVTCEVTDSDNNRVTKNTVVTFTKIEAVIPTINVPALLNGDLNQQVIGGVSAFDQVDGDITNQIVCTPSSNQIRINVNNGILEVIRNTNSSITTQVNCEVTNSNGNSAQGTTQVVFNEVITPNNPPELNTPDVLNGGINQQVQGQVSAFDIEDGDLTNEIVCHRTSGVISLQLNNGNLVVSRTTTNPISTTITCEVTDSDNNRVTKNTVVTFDRIQPPTINAPAVLNGSVNNQVIGQISAQDQIDGDLTNQISCTANSNRISITLVNGQLTVQREDRLASDSQVNCEVTNSNGLSATSSTQVLFDLQNQAPLVNITPSVNSGFEVLLVDFNISAVDPDGDQITCEVFINGVSRFTNQCSGFTQEFNQGIYTIKVVVTDEFGLTGTNSTTIEVFEKLPQEVTLQVNPQRVFVGDRVQINYTVVDQANFVNCVLETNGRLLQAIGGGNCIGNFTLNTSYNQIGEYDVTLTTVDKNGNTVVLVEQVEVIEALSPQGTLVATPKQSFEPSNIEVNVNITHPQNLSVTCEVFNNGVIIGNECVETITLTNVVGGSYTFTARGVDERGNTVELSDSVLVFREEDKLENQSIIVDTESGDNSNVDVTITFANETLAQRVTRFRPYIVCEDGVVNSLQNEQWINAALKSRNMMNDVVFDFELFINDFQLRVEYDKECTLVVEFWDNYGFIDQRSAPITFIRPTQEAGIPSIRGQGIDFRNHLTTLLQDSTFKSGYNQFSVVLINNENEVKTVEYTITGQQIFVQSNGRYVLQPFEERVVPMNIMVPQGTEDGTYLVRITMTHNGVRESKLTHIRVGENSMLPTYTIGQNEEGFGRESGISLPASCSNC
ncbi:MAG: hypothetical protein LAT82_00350, partial [Nanoarchaeota archaeon]|nr:hypothetical protein [Nanoarchaeota archaeon]